VYNRDSFVIFRSTICLPKTSFSPKLPSSRSIRNAIRCDMDLCVRVQTLTRVAYRQHIAMVSPDAGGVTRARRVADKIGAASVVTSEPPPRSRHTTTQFTIASARLSTHTHTHLICSFETSRCRESSRVDAAGRRRERHDLFYHRRYYRHGSAPTVCVRPLLFAITITERIACQLFYE
jgi:hypothetical protein